MQRTDDSAPRSTIAAIDAETRHLLPEESWFGAEFQDRAAPWEQDYSLADTYNTGAFTVWGPSSRDLPEESKPYATDASKLAKQVAKDEKRQARAVRKFDQLVRHGMVVGDRDRLKPLLALHDVDSKERQRKRDAAQKLINQYVYESSDDEAEIQYLSKQSRAKPKQGRFLKLQQALSKLEQPPARIQNNDVFRSRGDWGVIVEGVADQPQTRPGQLSSFAMQKTLSGTPAAREEDHRPTLGCEKAMRDPKHPDFGMDFSAALRLAMAKEKKAHVLAIPDDFWDPDDTDSEGGTIIVATPERNALDTTKRAPHATSARPRPQTTHHLIRGAKTGIQPKYDIVEYAVARASQTGGLDFCDTRLVDIFNAIMQQDNASRPVRSQASLLEVFQTDPIEYFGEDLLALLESDSYSEQVELAMARLVPSLGLSSRREGNTN